MEQLELARQEQSTSSLAILHSHQCWDCSLTLSHCLLIPQIPHTVIWGVQALPMQEWSLTIHLRCEWTLPGHAPGVTSRTSHCRVSPARPYSTSATAWPHAGHLQSKWQLLTPQAAIVEQPALPQIHTGAYPEVTRPGHRSPLIRSRLFHVQ